MKSLATALLLVVLLTSAAVAQTAWDPELQTWRGINFEIAIGP